MKRTVISAISFALLFFCLSGAHGLTVTNTDDSGNGSLRQAISTTPSGGTIDFNIPTSDPNYSPATSSYLIRIASGELVIARDVTITGPANSKVTVSGNNNNRIFNISAGNVALTNLTIANGRAAGSNGAAEITGAGAQPAQPGQSMSGGAILNAGALTLRNCTLNASQVSGGRGGNGNSTGAFGYGAPAGSAKGGALANFGSATLINCTLFSNHAVGGDGGNGTAGQPSGMGGAADGGAVWNGGTLTLVNSTLFSHLSMGGSGGSGSGGSNGANGGSATGGGLTNASGASSVILNSIIAGSTVTGGPRGFAAPGGTAGTIGTASGTDVSGDVVSQGHNLIGRTDGSTGWTGSDLLGGTTSATRLDPLLSSFGDYGGPTFTLRPMAASAAVDNGDDAVLAAPFSLTTDQRGFSRKVGLRVDIGAVENGFSQAGPTFTVTSTDAHNDGTCTEDDCTLREAVNAANANPDASTVVFAAGLGSLISNPPSNGYAITAPLAILGPGARRMTLSGGNLTRIFAVQSAGVTISGLNLTGGRSFGDGGIMHNSGGSTTVSDCTLSSSTAVMSSPGLGNGGAIFNASGAGLTLLRCTFASNDAQQFGGALYNSGTVTATNCTFVFNTAPRGGAIFSLSNNGTSLVTLRNCTVTGNNATAATNSTDGGGGYYADGAAGNSQHRFSNTIISGNTNAVNPDLRGFGTTEGNNLIGNLGQGGSGFSNGVNGDKVGVPANFGTFGNFGGPTDTMRLLSNSPAINSGNDALAPTTDQRGYPRVGASDIGAFEFGSGSLRATNIIRSGDDIVVEFREAIANVSYRLERKAEITDATWQPINGVADKTPTSTGRNQIIHPGGASSVRGFYRVRQLP